MAPNFILLHMLKNDFILWPTGNQSKLTMLLGEDGAGGLQK